MLYIRCHLLVHYTEYRECFTIVVTQTITIPCYISFAKINLVIMAGEKGTEIRDDKPWSELALSYENQHHMAVTLFEHTVYLLRIQLDCSSQLGTELTETGCNLAQDVNVWIDLNDDGKFDPSEIGTPYPWPVTSYMAEGIYDIQIYVPSFDSRYLTSGPHRMCIAVAPSAYYERQYGHSIDATPISALPHNAACSPDVGKIILVMMAGEHRTQIRDDESTTAALTGNTQNYQHRYIVLYEDTIYLLRIQFECTAPSDTSSVDNNCNLSHDVAAYIDLNNDGKYDNTEYAAPYRWPLTSYMPKGIYDLQIYVPIINETKMKSGPHLLRLEVMLNEQYREKCGKNYYRETREYNVTILRNMKQSVDIGDPYLTLSDSICSQTSGKVVLVIMAGEQGSHIRDDTPINTIIRQDQTRHHMAVTLYENAIYRIRIQLDCDQRSTKGSFKVSCNLAYDVNVFIDLNNDGIFDESESRISHRWPLRSTMTIGIYDLEIPIPSINEQTMRSGSHLMRNKVMYCMPGSFACSEGNNAIFMVKLLGEQNTEILDETKKCSSTNNYNDRSDIAVTLFDNTVYGLQIELCCVKQSDYDNLSSQDSSVFQTHCDNARYLGVWIDFNDDGTFDERTERLAPNDWYREDPQMTRYDLSIAIPGIDDRYYFSGQHRMRIVLSQDERNRKPCQATGYGEVRDYTVQIMQTTAH
ncbi:unnamed protein product [Rotaria sp. Silwood2]|nr:unnamed protein product [Rotaria sp. Silwood2]CAF4094662.1 unnamed protein product [Rotaria sp. Silwood2]